MTELLDVKHLEQLQLENKVAFLSGIHSSFPPLGEQLYHLGEWVGGWLKGHRGAGPHPDSLSRSSGCGI